ncbi:MAG: hypothetical protein WA144_12235 [Candidatus Methanoperedens sp.]
MVMAKKAAQFYKSVGQTSAKILSMDETGNKSIEFDVTYFIQKTGPEPEIIMFIAHQDEGKAMKELGLLG